MKYTLAVAINYLDDACNRATKDSTHVGHWQQPSPLSNCFSPVLLSLSPLYASMCSLAFLAFFVLRKSRSARFWYSSCCLFGKHGLSIFNASPGLFSKVGLLLFAHIDVSLISCLLSVFSKFPKNISGGMYEAFPHHFRWFSTVAINWFIRIWCIIHLQLSGIYRTD